MTDEIYKNYNFWDPNIYVKYGKPQFELVNKVLDKVLKKYPLKGYENILDIGCGTGNITALLAQTVPRGKVIGIDQSSNMIDFASKTYGDIINLSFKVQSAVDFSLDLRFDLVVCFNTLHLVADQITALNTINEHLTDNGKFLVVMARPQDGSEPINDAIVSVVYDPKWQAYFTNYAVPDYLIGFTRDQYKDAIIDAGFKILYFSEVDNFIQFSTKEEFADWIQTWLSHRLAIPPELRKKFFLQIVEKYTRAMNQTLDNIGFHYVVWEYLVQKDTTME